MIPKEVTKYEASNGELFNTIEEAGQKEKELNYEIIATSFDGWLENSYPDKYGIMFEVMLAIKNTLGKLTKKELTDLINYYKEKTTEEG